MSISSHGTARSADSLIAVWLFWREKGTGKEKTKYKEKYRKLTKDEYTIFNKWVQTGLLLFLQSVGSFFIAKPKTFTLQWAFVKKKTTPVWSRLNGESQYQKALFPPRLYFFVFPPVYMRLWHG